MSNLERTKKATNPICYPHSLQKQCLVLLTKKALFSECSETELKKIKVIIKILYYNFLLLILKILKFYNIILLRQNSLKGLLKKTLKIPWKTLFTNVWLNRGPRESTVKFAIVVFYKIYNQ